MSMKWVIDMTERFFVIGARSVFLIWGKGKEGPTGTGRYGEVNCL